MLKALLDKVGNVLEKEFLFGAFLPALLFAASVVTTFAMVIGFQASFHWLAQLGDLEKVVAPVAATLAVVLFAYVLSGIRPLLIHWWRGEQWWLLPPPIASLFRSRARHRYLRWRRTSREPNRWHDLVEWLNDRADALWDASKQQSAVSPDDRESLRKWLRTLSQSMSRSAVEDAVTQSFLSLLKRASCESLETEFCELRETFDEWRQLEEQRISVALWKLDRSYGSLRSIQPTRLGNVMESYSEYSFKRYGIEPDVFWPHLQVVISDKLRAALAESRTMFDFALTSATLAATYIMLCAFAGPWLYLSWKFWGLCVVAGLLVTFAAYNTAVTVAAQFGDLFRASFDLHRIDLLTALHRRLPATLGAERERWSELSQLVVYGQSADFELAEGGKQPAPATVPTAPPPDWPPEP